MLRVFAYIVPLAASLVAAYVLAALVPLVNGAFGVVARFCLIAALSTVVLVGVERLARHLLPLIALLDLTLLFPDRAPSRFHIAIRSGTTAQLRKRIAEFDAASADSGPGAAAQRLLGLVAALSAHDRLTRGHSERVRAYAQMIGTEMGLQGRELDQLRWSALLHDIGKLRIDADILNKPGKLTAAEFEIIKQHPAIGSAFVAPLADWLGDAVRAVAEHHERWDGNGYPNGLAGNDIAFAARIVSVADTFDVMTSVRSYKRPQSAATARQELARCSGTQFDPAVVRAFLNVSLGRLWFTIGPLSWLAQASLVPRAFAAGLNGSSAALATVGGLVVSGVAVVPDLPIPRTTVVEAAGPDATIGTTVNKIGSIFLAPPLGSPGAPTTTTAAAGPGESSTTSTPTATPTATPTTSATPTTATTPTTSATPTTKPSASTPTTKPASTTSTVPAAPPPSPTLPPITLPSITLPPITLPPITLPPLLTGATTRLRLAATQAGDTASSNQLSLVAREPLNAALPNHDTNRNADPGLTLRRPGAMNNADGPTIQRFRFAPLVPLLVGPTTLTLFVAPKGMDTDAIQVSAALYSCGTLLQGCTQFAIATQSFVGTANEFTPLQFNFGNPNRLIGLTSQLELRIVVDAVSGDDAWIAFDTVGRVSELVIS